MRTFTTTVEQYDDTQDYYIEIPHYILEELDWKEGDTLDWQITDSKQIIITKVKDSSSTQEEHQQTNNDWYTIKGQAIKEHIEELTEHFFQDYDEVYDDYIQATNEDTYGDQGNEQSKDRTVPPPTNFPHFP